MDAVNMQVAGKMIKEMGREPWYTTSETKIMMELYLVTLEIGKEMRDQEKVLCASLTTVYTMDYGPTTCVKDQEH